MPAAIDDPMNDTIGVSRAQNKVKDSLQLVLIGGLMLALGWFIADKLFGESIPPTPQNIPTKGGYSMVYKEEKWGLDGKRGAKMHYFSFILFRLMPERY